MQLMTINSSAEVLYRTMHQSTFYIFLNISLTFLQFGCCYSTSLYMFNSVVSTVITSTYRNQSQTAAFKQTYLKVFKLTHFSAIAVINEIVTAQPLIFIVKTNGNIRSIRAKVFSVRFKPRKSASLQSE